MASRNDSPAIRSPFIFNQTRLADFDLCRRLFLLRWVQHLEWPQRPTTAYDDMMLLQRRRFHRLLHRFYSGVDVEGLVDDEPDGSPLRAWWESFQQYPPPGLPNMCYPELALGTLLDDHRLTARFDLLAVDLGRRAVIVDWKTGRRLATPEDARASWQTIVYQYVWVEAGMAHNAGTAPRPEEMEMIYWYAEYPASPIRLDYSQDEHDVNHERLRDRIAEIAALPASEFTPCDAVRTCARCPYATFCGRAGDGGEVPEAEDAVYDEIWDASDVFEYEC